MTTEAESRSDFIRTIISEDIEACKHDGRVQTRFPPEPNGYLHVGHAKSICLNFGLAKEFNGKCNLRFDDTNPSKEEVEYIESIKRDIEWLGWEWDAELYASDYFDQLYEFALKLIKAGKAYVDDLNADQIREYRGTLTRPGKASPYRDRPVDENVDLFDRMRAGEFADGQKVLRAKIDMTSPNLNLRDPVMYRIQRHTHHRTGDKWCIYPMYDFAHGQSDSMEQITHSICTLEFEAHRPLYEWFIKELDIFPSRQIEFARLNVTYMVTSKRKLLQLVTEGHVRSWDDPRMPTISAFRRRGYSPEAIRTFCENIGVAKRENTIEIQMFEHFLREDLNKRALRVMAVLDPVKVIVDTYPDDLVEQMDAINNPEDPDAGTRKVPFTKELYIERSDFMEEPPKKFFRLAPGREVRLRYGYLVTCTHVVKDDDGNVIEIHCTHDPETKGGTTPDGRKVKGTLHWVSATHCLKGEARLYEYLFTQEDPTDVEEGQDFTSKVNPDSLKTTECCLEPSLADAEPGTYYQFERTGYFMADPDSTDDHKVFNRTVALRDSWSKMQKKR